MTQWNDTQPIFLQIRQRIVELILKGLAPEGEPLPSVRQVSTELSVNPLTVTKAFQALVDAGIVEKRRGLGMYVTAGAQEKLLRQEREKFLAEDWPRIMQQVEALGLDVTELLNKEAGK
ncbi:MAG TPA: GntR family transcriptional regulator [Devosiaceae bacterium]